MTDALQRNFSLVQYIPSKKNLVEARTTWIVRFALWHYQRSAGVHVIKIATRARVLRAEWKPQLYAFGGLLF